MFLWSTWNTMPEENEYINKRTVEWSSFNFIWVSKLKFDGTVKILARENFQKVCLDLTFKSFTLKMWPNFALWFWIYIPFLVITLQKISTHFFKEPIPFWNVELFWLRQILIGEKLQKRQLYFDTNNFMKNVLCFPKKSL